MAMAGAGTAFVGGSLALAPLKVFLLDAEDGGENEEISVIGHDISWMFLVYRDTIGRTM